MAILPAIPPARLSRETVIAVNQGVFLDRPSIRVPKGGMIDCLNVRVKDKQVRNENMGWETFPPGATAVNLDNEQALMIEQFFDRTGAQILLFANKFDLFRFDGATDLLHYATPQYGTGTVLSIGAGPNSTVTGTGGTLWDTAAGQRAAQVRAGDFIAFGTANYTDQLPAAAWYPIASVASDTSLVVTGDASSESTGAYTIRLTLAGDEFDRFKAATFPAALPEDEDQIYLTNGVDAPMFWDGDSSPDAGFLYYDPGFTSRILTYTKNMLIYGDIVESGERKSLGFRNSNVANPRDVTTGLASEIVSTDGIDMVLEYKPLGDVLVAYHERSINILQFVGLPFIFIVRTAIPGIGPIAAGAIADFGDFHKFIGPDRAYAFDGVAIQEFGSQVFRELLRIISPDRLARTISHIDEEQGETHWITPLTSDTAPTSFAGPEKAFTEHYLEKIPSGLTPMTIRELPATATGYFDRISTITFATIVGDWESFNFAWDDRFFEAAFPFNLFGDENGNIFVLGTDDDQAGVALNSFARFGRVPVGDGRNQGIIKRIEPFAMERPAATVPLTIKIFGADGVERDAVLKATQTFDLTFGGLRFASFRAMMRYAEVEFSTNALNARWEVDGFAYDRQIAAER